MRKDLAICLSEAAASARQSARLANASPSDDSRLSPKRQRGTCLADASASDSLRGGLALFVVACSAIVIAAQPPAEKKTDFGAVREEHRMLATLVGAFDVKQKEFNDKGDVEEEWTGSLERAMTLEGRFLEEKATLMGKRGMSKNLVWLGFDARKGKFVAVTVNSQSTLPLISEGTWDKDKKEITFLDEEFDPDTKKLVARTREVYRVVSEDEQVFEEHVQLGNDKEHRTLEIRYQRKHEK